MYIMNPVTHEGLIKYISYTLAGSDIKEQLTRRYSDFFALREKLREVWPGVYVPLIPPKQSIGNTEKAFIKKRARLINKFCYKLSKFPFMYSCDEVLVFQTYKNDYAKFAEKKPKVSVANILENYKAAFTDYPENYDMILGKSRIKEYEVFAKKTALNLKTFHECIIKCSTRREAEMKAYFDMMKEMEFYENEVLKPYTGNNEEKLILANTKSPATKEKADGLEKCLNNPYIALEEWIEEERLDIDAVLEAFASLNNLSTRVEKLGVKIENIDHETKQLQYGKQGFISGLLKSKDAKMTELENEKTKSIQDLEGLDIINKMAYFRMEQFFKEFKEQKVLSYYKAMKLYALLQRDNDMYNHELWNEAKNAVINIKTGAS